MFCRLTPGDTGPDAELLQLGLCRAGFLREITGCIDGETEEALLALASSRGLKRVRYAGRSAWKALLPYLKGYVVYTARGGESLDDVASLFGADPALVAAANPGVHERAKAGLRLKVPLPYDVVPADVSFTSKVLELCVEGICARYPFIRAYAAGCSVMGRRLHALEIGEGPRYVFFSGAHHANEWITSPLLLRFIEEYARAYAVGGKVAGFDAGRLYSESTLTVVPMVNPDGVDLATGALRRGRRYRRARAMARSNAAVLFPQGWKANIRGVDLNLQYPAGWENARQIKRSLGVSGPGPRDYVGPSPLSEPESRALEWLTRRRGFDIVLAFHTQGRVIYWKYLDFVPKNSLELAESFASASSYALEDVPAESGFAGYKDWFILKTGRPGFTIEAGEGVSPLPLEQFEKIYSECLGIMAVALAGGR